MEVRVAAGVGAAVLAGVEVCVGELGAPSVEAAFERGAELACGALAGVVGTDEVEAFGLFGVAG